jgi:hypothetical protein
MKELREGIYKYNEKIISPTGYPVVLIHPWWLGTSDIWNILGEDYIEQLKRLLKNAVNSQIIVFEETFDCKKAKSEKYLLDSLKLVEKMRGSGKGIYGICTQEGPDPRYCEWSDAANFILAMSSKIKLGGGYYRKSYTDGCASVARYELAQRGIEVIVLKQCCFDA